MQERSRTQSAHVQSRKADSEPARKDESTPHYIPLKDGKEIKKAVNEAESYLRSYLSSLKTIGAYGATEMGKMRNQSRVQSIDPKATQIFLNRSLTHSPKWNSICNFAPNSKGNTSPILFALTPA